MSIMRSSIYYENICRNAYLTPFYRVIIFKNKKTQNFFLNFFKLFLIRLQHNYDKLF